MSAALRLVRSDAPSPSPAGGAAHPLHSERPWGPGHPAKAYLASLRSKASRETMAQALDVAARLLSDGELDHRTLAWEHVTSEQAGVLHSRLLDHPAPASDAGAGDGGRLYAASTVNKIAAAVRGVMRRAWLLGHVDVEVSQRAVAALPRTRGDNTEPAGREVDGTDRAALFAACAGDETLAGRRDAALLALLYGAGLRRAEAAGLTTASVELAEARLRIRGKGRKVRTVYLGDDCLTLLAQWIEVRARALGELGVDGAAERGRVFLPITKDAPKQSRGSTGPRIGGDRLSAQAIYAIVRRRAREAGVRRLSPHDFRRTFIGDLLSAGVDIATTAAVVGHSSVTTTARYDRRGDKAKRLAAAAITLPSG